MSPRLEFSCSCVVYIHLERSEPMEEDAQGGKAKPARQKKVPHLERTLAILVQSMRGNRIVVELKNDVEICGVLEETDQHMNLSMVGVRQTNPNGSVRRMDMVLIQGRMIRYVHIPDDISAISNLHRHMRAMDTSAASYKRNMLKPTAPSP